MSEASAIFIPIQLNALVVNEATDKNKFKNMAMKLDRLNNPDVYQNLGSFLENDIADNSGMTYEKGVHLQWVLPSAYRHASLSEDQASLDFPKAPNRWLILRTQAADEVTLKAWIVESDANVAPNGKEVQNTRPNWIAEPDQHNDFHSPILGRVSQLQPNSNWKEAGGDVFLSIMPAGIPDFAASYAQSKGIFGFHDPLASDDLNKVFSYHVFGWLSDPNADLLSGIENRAALLKLLDQFNWNYQAAEGTPSTDSFPMVCICHGFVHSLKYDQIFRSNVPNRNDVEISIGNSPSEAMAALLKPTQTREAAAIQEKLLAAYQFGLLQENGLPRSFANQGANPIERPLQALHARGFQAVNGGNTWGIQKKQSTNSAPEGNSPIHFFQAFAPAVSNALLQLNQLQASLETKQNELASHQDQLNALCYKMVYQFNGFFELPADNTPENAQILQILNPGGALQQAIGLQNSACEHLAQEIQQLEAQIGNIADLGGSAVGQLRQAMLNDPNLADYELVILPLPKYFSPGAPNIVFNGIQPSKIYIQNIAANQPPLACRSIDVLSKAVNIVYNGSNYVVALADLPFDNTATGKNDSILPTGIGAAPSALQAIVNDSLLLDPNCATAISKHLTYLVNVGPISPEKIGYPQLIQQAFLAGLKQQQFMATTTPSILPPQFAANLWSQPWIPMFLEWEVFWEGKSLPTNIEEFWKDWKFGNANQNHAAIDFEYVGQQEGKGFRFLGRTLLSGDMVNKTKDLNQLLGDVFENYQPLSQDLGDLQGQLIQRISSVQLPYRVPQNAADFDFDMAQLKELFSRANQNIGDHGNWIPLLDNSASPTTQYSQSFMPLRGGKMRLSMLRIIDAFGQMLELIDEDREIQIKPEKVHRSRGMQAVQDAPLTFRLPPRLIQPTRLRCEWLSAAFPGRKTDSDPATTPICGWLMHNQLDGVVVVYDLEGRELGALTAHQNGMALVPPPGRSATTIENDVLNNFVQSFLSVDKAQASKRLDELIAQIRQITQKIQVKPSRQNLGMQLPIGFPIAIVQLECNLERKHLPAKPQFWLSDPMSDPSTDSLLDLPFETRIGNANSRLDGLVGFFADNNFDKMCLPANAEAINSEFLSTQDDIYLKLSRPRTFTCLVDPRMSIELSTGILPMLRIELPSHALHTPLQAMEIRFLAAPILTQLQDVDAEGSLQLDIPLKEIQGKEWVWQSSHSQVPFADQKIELTNGQTFSFRRVQALEGYFTLKNKS